MNSLRRLGMVFFLGLAVLTTSACGSGTSDAPKAVVDAGVGSQFQPRGGDVATTSDGAAVADVGAAIDAASVTADASGQPVDAVATDAATAGVTDAGAAPVDVASSADTSTADSTAAPVDAAATIDAGGTVDAGAPVDAGSGPVACQFGAMSTCAPGEYCKLPAAIMACSGAGECAAMNCMCPKLLKPVCGCDDVTYSNACLAGCKGRNVKSDGKCPPVISCGDGQCNGKETCTTCPKDCGACPPTCKVHSDCDDQAKCTVDTCDKGKCVHTTIPKAMCDQMCVIEQKGSCKPGMYCDAYTSNKVGICTGLGVCMLLGKPKVCAAGGAAVCGCDGKTYASACHAKQVGINVMANTACAGGGVCKKGWFKPMSGGACVEATCNNMGKAYSQDLTAVIKGSVACAADADCTIVNTWTDCAGTCGSSVNVAKKAEVTKVVDWLDKNICKPFGYKSKCGFSQPMCMKQNPGCVANKCVYNKPSGGACKKGWFKPMSGGACVEATCKNMGKSYSDDLTDTIQKSNACAVDADCIIVTTWTDCAGTCGASVNVAKKDEVTKVVGWLDKNICKAFGYKTKCGFAQPKCMKPQPGCVASKCVYFKP